MKNLLLLITSMAFVVTSCSNDDDIISMSSEINTIDSVDHVIATEILRLSILSEYGGAFKQLKLFGEHVLDLGMPCGSEDSFNVEEGLAQQYSLTIPYDVSSFCNNLGYIIYFGNQRNGSQKVSSEILELDIFLQGSQNFKKNFESNDCVYWQSGIRNIIINSGIASEIDPRSTLNLALSDSYYDVESDEMQSDFTHTFNLEIRTFENAQSRSIEFEGTIQSVDGEWAVLYDDGIVHTL